MDLRLLTVSIATWCVNATCEEELAQRINRLGRDNMILGLCHGDTVDDRRVGVGGGGGLKKTSHQITHLASAVNMLIETSTRATAAVGLCQRASTVSNVCFAATSAIKAFSRASRQRRLEAKCVWFTTHYCISLLEVDQLS